MKEPSILDYLKSLLDQDKHISLGEYLELSKKTEAKPVKKKSSRQDARISWQVVFGCLLTFGAQFFLEPDHRRVSLSIILYLIAGVLIWAGYKNSDLRLFDRAERNTTPSFSSNIRLLYFGLCLVFMVAAFLMFKDNTFTRLNVTLWLLSILFFFLSVWEKQTPAKEQHKKDPTFYILFLLIFAVCVFFRFYRLNQVPGEMFSDHAEKLLDVMDVLNGKTSIFFTRNTGREAFQFYLTVAVIKLFHTGVSFLSLKLGTAFAGLATLPFIYLLGKQLGNKWVGLTAMLMAGIAYWPNIISRVALRFTLYPLFTAPVMYYLFRGLQNRNRNDLLISGIFLGMGLHGYSPARILPIYVVTVFILYELHRPKSKDRWNDIWVLGLLAFAAFIVFLPLFRYFLEHPELVSSRALSRLTSAEHAISGSPWLVFFNNLWKAMIMFFYDNGQIWVHSIPNRPALDIAGAVFLFTGLVYEIKKYLKYRNWEDLALLVAIPILMLPSITSLAFPDENPSLNRTGGAIVPVFLIAAIGFYQCARGVFSKRASLLSKGILSLFLVVVLALSMYQNYDLVFHQYADQFMANAWNSDEMGKVIADFAAQGNSYEHAYVVPYPYWVDTRLVAINAGVPGIDYALWPEDFRNRLNYQGNKLMLLNPEDTDSLDLLRSMFPDGKEEIFHSKTAGKDFIIYSIAQN